MLQCPSHSTGRQSVLTSAQRPTAETWFPLTPLFILPPPFVRFTVFGRAFREDVGRLPVGSFMALPVEQGFSPSLHASILALRRLLPAVPLVLVLRGGTHADVALLARQVVRLGVRAVLIEGERPRPSLVRQMLDPSTLAGDILEWLELRRLAVPLDVKAHVAAIIDRGPEFHSLKALFASLGQSDRTIRDHFSRSGLPAAREWWQAASAVRVALRLQADPRLTVSRLAVELGRPHASPLTHQVVRALGFRPTEVRRMLGWEALLDRWVRRHWLGEDLLAIRDRRAQEAQGRLGRMMLCPGDERAPRSGDSFVANGGRLPEVLLVSPCRGT